MIQIRNLMFETNSSSCHVFVYDPKGSAQVQKTVTLVPNSDDSMLNILFNDFYCWHRPEREFEDDYIGGFLNNLLAIGVRTVKCSDENVVKLFELYKEKGNYYCNNKDGLIQVLFNDTTKLTTMEDFEVCPEAVEKEFGKGYKYLSLRLS